MPQHSQECGVMMRPTTSPFNIMHLPPPPPTNERLKGQDVHDFWSKFTSYRVSRNIGIGYSTGFIRLRYDIKYRNKDGVALGFCIENAKWYEVDYLMTTNLDDMKWARLKSSILPTYEEVQVALANKDYDLWVKLRERVDFHPMVTTV